VANAVARIGRMKESSMRRKGGKDRQRRRGNCGGERQGFWPDADVMIMYSSVECPCTVCMRATRKGVGDEREGVGNE
jgi:hypothetical protein